MNLLQFSNAKRIILLIDIPVEWVDISLKVHKPKKKGEICIVDEETAKLMKENGYAEILD